MKKSSLNNLEYLDISQEVNALQVPNTPLSSYLLGAGKVETARSTGIKWREYGMNNDNSFVQLEDGEYAGAESGRIWFNNYTETFKESTSVPDTLDVVSIDGVGDELSSQVALRATEMKIGSNCRLIVGVKADESGSKGHQMSGILNLISSTNKVETTAAGAVARKDTSALFKAMFQRGYVDEKLCLVAPDMQELMTDQLDKKSTKIM